LNRVDFKPRYLAGLMSTTSISPMSTRAYHLGQVGHDHDVVPASSRRADDAFANSAR